jgi:hypothetical protein
LEHIIKLIPDAFAAKIKGWDKSLDSPRPNRSLLFAEFDRKFRLGEQQPTTATVILFPLTSRLLPVIPWRLPQLFFHFVFVAPVFTLAACRSKT